MAGGGSGGDGGSSGMGLGGMSPDAGPEAGAGNGGSGGFMYPADCPQPNAIPADADQSLVIQSVNLNTSQIVVRNASSDDLTVQGGQMGAQWCNIPAYDFVAYENVILEPGQTLAFYPIQNGSALRPLPPGDDAQEPNELVIYTTTGSFDEPNLVAAFVSWGFGDDNGREVTASMGNKWIFGDRVAIGRGHDGFIITGNADEGDGYTSVDEHCLVAPPNPPGVMVPMPP
jgi:hypothetical protein